MSADRGETANLTPEQQAEIHKLESLGYLGGSVVGDQGDGLIVDDEARADRGLRLWISGHYPGAYLMSADGDVVHTWTYRYEDVWARDKTHFLKPSAGGTTNFWRRVHPYPNGDLLVIFQGHGLIKVDKDSRLLWGYADYCHHHLCVDADGLIHVLTSEAKIVPRLNAVEPVRIDYITTLDPDGGFLRKISLLAAFEHSEFAPLLATMPPAGDVMHTNSLRILDGSQVDRSPYFAQGNYLISIREMNVVAVLDPRSESIVWATSGLWLAQHDPTLLANGDMLLFDNLGNGGRSKVIEFDPFTMDIVWSYGQEQGQSLFSETEGTTQRLPNGDTMITESNNGRVIEVTGDGTIVWEYDSPYRVGDKDQWIAVIPDMMVLPAGYFGNRLGE